MILVTQRATAGQTHLWASVSSTLPAQDRAQGDSSRANLGRTDQVATGDGPVGVCPKTDAPTGRETR